MPPPDRPRLRRLESFPVTQPDGQVLFALRDPEGFGASVVLAYPAARLASLMDGQRTWDELLAEFERETRGTATRDDVRQLVEQLDERLLLDSERFRAHWKQQLERYYNTPVRPAAHAGGGYPADPQELERTLAELFAGYATGGAPSTATTGTLCGLLSPHVDLRRGARVFAPVYRELPERTDADLFVLLGASHNPLGNPFSVTRKDFETPLGTVATDRKFIGRLSQRLAATPGGRELNLGGDELAHRFEHSLEFQAVLLQYLVRGVRPFAIVPVLVGSWSQLQAPAGAVDTAPLAAFADAVRQTASEHAGRVLYIATGDLAHIGQRYGDREFLGPQQLREQAAADQQLLTIAAGGDATALAQAIGTRADQRRLAGLAPLCALLAIARPDRGELLRYDQAVELDGTACVSFAGMQFFDA